jgi:hypothetical protein
MAASSALFLSSLFIFISTTTPAIYASLVAQPPPPVHALYIHALYLHAFLSMLIFTPIAARESEPFHFGVMKRLKCRTGAFKNLHHFW